MSALIALTGGIGAGKSVVASLLREHGATTIDADVVARECADDPDIQRGLSTLAPAAFTSAGQLSRAVLAELMFADTQLRRSVERLMHPWIRQRMAALGSAATAQGADVVVFEIPLLAETRTPQEAAVEFDGVISVEADEAVRLDRLRLRGMMVEDARARMAAQGTDEQRKALATWVVDNNADNQALAQRVSEIWADIHSRAKSSHP